MDEKKIDEIFPPETFSKIIYGRSISIKTNELEPKDCVSFRLNTNDIYVSRLSKCVITGSKLLEKVEEFAKTMPQIKTFV